MHAQLRLAAPIAGVIFLAGCSANSPTDVTTVAASELATAAAPARRLTPAPRSLRTPMVHFPLRPGGAPKRGAAQVRSSVGAARLPAGASPDVLPATCPDEAASMGAVCGYVNVPFDRDKPGHATIGIYFELYAHSGAGPAQSAVMVNFGGPGLTTTGLRGLSLSVFGANLDSHDVLLVDDRGRGFSGAIDCEEIQHGTAPMTQAITDCAAQLGRAASLYGTGDVAQDTDAVRTALGYDKVDYYGGSYGGADVTAYATRYAKHLRSIVLDAPVGTPGLDPFVFARDRTKSLPRMVSKDCLHSPTCSADHPFPTAELDALVATIRARPVEGDAHDADGNLAHVRIDEDALLNYLLNNPLGDYINTGELLAAADSMWQGDPGPILRLGAESYLPLITDNGDPAGFFSTGSAYATGCVDALEPWQWSAPVSARTKHYDKAVSDLPPDYFAPFSKGPPMGPLYSSFGSPCLTWQAPTRSSPVAPARAQYPDVPTLVLDSELDYAVPFEQATKVAALFPNSTFVPVAEASHETVIYSQCAANLASSFVETLQVGDTTCTRTPETTFPAVGRFPLLARGARPADVDPGGTNQIGTSERKVVTVSLAAATDALHRAMLSYISGGAGAGVGLRAGTFQTDFSSSPWTMTLTGCAFATDVTASGTLAWTWADGTFVADLVVAGPGTAGGTLHIEGITWVPGPVGNFKITGILGGKQVAVLIPWA